MFCTAPSGRITLAPQTSLGFAIRSQGRFLDNSWINLTHARELSAAEKVGEFLSAPDYRAQRASVDSERVGALLGAEGAENRNAQPSWCE